MKLIGSILDGATRTVAEPEPEPEPEGLDEWIRFRPGDIEPRQPSL